MKFPLVPLVAFAFGFAAPIALAEQAQPRMENATELLEKAKASKDPLPLLEKARENLKDAKHNKGGRRPEAIKAVDEAIDAVKSGGDPTSKITHAIAMVRAGMDKGR